MKDGSGVPRIPHRGGKGEGGGPRGRQGGRPGGKAEDKRGQSLVTR